MKWGIAALGLGCLVLLLKYTKKETSIGPVIAKNYVKERPLIIAHRGASGYRPEHSLETYQLAIAQGADFIEPDLVVTKDGVLIARHENELSETTDVKQKFPNRRTRKKVDGKWIEGWFSEDFSLQEIKQLRVKERLESRNASYNYCCEIPTFLEILEQLDAYNRMAKVKVGVYPELKHPAYFRDSELDLESKLIEALAKFPNFQSDSLVLVQSFEIESLRILSKRVELPLVFLIWKDPLPAQKLNEYSEFLYGIGVNKDLIHKNPEFIETVHANGLKIHAYTFRSDSPFLGSEYNSDPIKEYLHFFQLGVDGVFTDFPDHAIQALNIFTQ